LSAIYFTATAFAQLDVFTYPGLACTLRGVTFQDKLVTMTVIVPCVVLYLGLPSAICWLMMWSKTGVALERWRTKLYHCHSAFFYSVLFFTFITYGSTSKVVFDTFACVDLGVDGKWLKSKMDTICPANDPDSIAYWWAIIMVIVYPIGIPLSFWALLEWHKVPQLVQRKVDRAYMKAILERFRLQNEVPEKLALLLHEDTAFNESDMLEKQIETRLTKLSDDIGHHHATQFGIPEFRLLCESMGLFDVEHSALQHMIDRYGFEGTIDHRGIHKMILTVLRVHHIVTGDEDPDCLTIPQLQELSAAGRFETQHYQPHHADHHLLRDAPDETDEPITRVVSSTYEEGAKSFESLKRAEIADGKSMSIVKDELTTTMLHRARAMEKRGELVAVEPGWDGASQEERTALDRLSFLLTSYRCKCWWYEVADMIRKLFMLWITVFVFDRTVSQVAAGMMITVVFLLLAMAHQPYWNRTLALMNLFSLSVQFITFFYGIIIATGELNELAGEEGSSMRAVMAVIVTILNCVLIFIPFLDLMMRITPTKMDVRHLLVYLGVKKAVIVPEVKEEEKEEAVQRSAEAELVFRPPPVEEPSNLKERLLTLKIFLRERAIEGRHFAADANEPEAAVRGLDAHQQKRVQISDNALAGGYLAEIKEEESPEIVAYAISETQTRLSHTPRKQRRSIESNTLPSPREIQQTPPEARVDLERVLGVDELIQRIAKPQSDRYGYQLQSGAVPPVPEPDIHSLGDTTVANRVKTRGADVVRERLSEGIDRPTNAGDRIIFSHDQNAPLLGEDAEKGFGLLFANEPPEVVEPSGGSVAPKVDAGPDTSHALHFGKESTAAKRQDSPLPSSPLRSIDSNSATAADGANTGNAGPALPGPEPRQRQLWPAFDGSDSEEEEEQPKPPFAEAGCSHSLRPQSPAVGTVLSGRGNMQAFPSTSTRDMGTGVLFSTPETGAGGTGGGPSHTFPSPHRQGHDSGKPISRITLSLPKDHHNQLFAQSPEASPRRMVPGMEEDNTASSLLQLNTLHVTQLPTELESPRQP